VRWYQEGAEEEETGEQNEEEELVESDEEVEENVDVRVTLPRCFHLRIG
jgi:hypothetical protein